MKIGDRFNYLVRCAQKGDQRIVGIVAEIVEINGEVYRIVVDTGRIGYMVSIFPSQIVGKSLSAKRDQAFRLMSILKRRMYTLLDQNDFQGALNTNLVRYNALRAYVYPGESKYSPGEFLNDWYECRYFEASL